jgi:long-chain acyl-CoA synthetase
MATVPREFLRYQALHPDAPCQWRRAGEAFVALSATDVAVRVWNLSRWLRHQRVEPGDRVVVLAATRPEWVQADLAIMAMGAVTVPIFPSLPPDQVAAICTDAGARFAFAENAELAAKLPVSLPRIVMESPEWTAAATAETPAPADLARWLEEDDAPEAGRRLATLVYTSGTTAHSRGVMLTHDNLLGNMRSLDRAAETAPDMAVGPADRALAFLPLSHIFERLVHLYFLLHGVGLYYSDPRRLAEDARLVHPTVLASVPRIYERIYAAMRAEASTPFRRRLLDRAFDAAVHRGAALTGGRPLRTGERLRLLFYDRVVYRRIRAALGGRLRYVISGGAALDPDLGRFFLGVGIPVCEGYGLTETSPVIAVNRPNDIRFGTVGRPLPDVEVRLADDGEILCRGPNVMQGYWGRPDDTAEALADGWFHTGDIGAWDSDGRLVVIDRKKSLIVLSTGKNVVPQPIEQRLAASPLIETAVVIGDNRKYVAVLLVPDFEELARLRTRLGIAAEGADLLRDPAVLAAFDEEVRHRTADLADFERPKRWALLPRPLTEEAGELTPSLKVKRRVVLEHFAAEVAACYPDDPPRAASS